MPADGSTPAEAPPVPAGEGEGRDTADEAASSGSGPRLSYLPGLDGLRAIAVLAVLLYHADYDWIPGGFLGVEVFFVISGYLITALLLAERKREGHIDLRSFWARRARRLLPALFLVLVGVVGLAVVFLPEEVAKLRGDVVAALTYSTNWYQIFSEQSYFEAIGRPSLLKHLWSLAVEEQFYLLWPFIFTVGMRRLGRRRFLALVVAGIAASTALMWTLYSPLEDPTRIYYGTDTRASGLLIGAALAFVWSPWRLRRRTGPGAGILLDVVGLLALVQLLRFFGSMGEFDEALYQGGFLLVGLVTAALIAVAVHPSSHLSGLHVGGALRWATLGNPVLQWVGLRSYGIYLWHWPVFMLTRPGIDVTWPSPVLFVVRFGITFGLAELSYRFVEQPVRHGALGRVWGGLTAPSPGRRATVRRTAVVASAGVVTLSLLAVAVVRATPPPPPDYLLAAGASTQVGDLPPATEDGTVPPPAVVDPTQGAAATTTPPTTAPATTTTVAGAPATTAAAPPPTTAPPPPPGPVPVDVGRVAALGDSVMAGAANSVYTKFAGKAHVDAAVNRQVSVGIQILQTWHDAGYLGDVVIVHLGNNGTFTDAQFDQMMQILATVPRVVFVTAKVPRGWEESVNRTLVNGVARYPNALLVDWRAHSLPHPEWFYDDAIHLRPAGAAAYAELIAAALVP